jgi:hypothetical protein
MDAPEQRVIMAETSKAAAGSGSSRPLYKS